MIDMKTILTIFSSAFLLCSWSFVSAVSVEVGDTYVEDNTLHISLTVICNSAETQTEHQIGLDQDGVPTNLPSGWSLDPDHYLIYSETVTCGDIGGSIRVGLPLGSHDEVVTDQIVQLHSCGSTGCECCRFVKEGDTVVGCECSFRTNCTTGGCPHSVQQVVVNSQE